MPLHLSCDFQVIKMPNEKVMALFITFSSNFYVALKSFKNRITPQLQDPLYRAFHKY